MQYTTSALPAQLTIALSGTFRFDDHDGFKGVLKAIDAYDGTVVHIDLSGTVAIDSAGVGMLLLAHERAKKQSKALSLGGASGPVQQVLELTRIATIMDVRS
ncbi:MAG: STAS domain-containing protein [Alphaproteobacteria bacterium]|nr:STAS domain-containing protein [Alphaproteobacteria bacterium]